MRDWESKPIIFYPTIQSSILVNAYSRDRGLPISLFQYMVSDCMDGRHFKTEYIGLQFDYCYSLYFFEEHIKIFQIIIIFFNLTRNRFGQIINDPFGMSYSCEFIQFDIRRHIKQNTVS